MDKNIHSKCDTLAQEALAILQSNKLGELSTALRKIELCARLIDDKGLINWCKFHFGALIQKLPKQPDIAGEKYIHELVISLNKLEIQYTPDEINARIGESGGGFNSIEFIENALIKFNKEKKGNDGTLYRNNIERTLNTCANAAYDHATKLYKTYTFGDIPSIQFDIIRNQVDDLLLDICPDAIEKFMSAYERLSSRSEEDWSLALTATRRVIKAVADVLYPPTDLEINGRKLGKEQYINRLWAFLDLHVPKGSDQDLTKAHINYLGSFIERLNKKASKGVHTKVKYKETVRTVLYTYLTLGDILEFAPMGVSSALKDIGKININTASIDELIEIDGISTKVAKDIIKMRVKSQIGSIDEIGQISGIGPKILDKIRKHCIAIK